jgi:hypothetical protein
MRDPLEFFRLATQKWACHWRIVPRLDTCRKPGGARTLGGVDEPEEARDSRS